MSKVWKAENKIRKGGKKGKETHRGSECEEKSSSSCRQVCL